MIAESARDGRTAAAERDGRRLRALSPGKGRIRLAGF